mmetsp:Transcript_1542/g.3980  ORF Transcript_1542/g.3980 Transcript_1542/m.3980 type:complete len:679 (-) Transcript_1542:178-2214(-)
MSFAGQAGLYTTSTRRSGVGVTEPTAQTYSRRAGSSYGTTDVIVDDIGVSPVRASTYATEQGMTSVATGLAANEVMMCEAIMQEVRRELGGLNASLRHNEILEAVTNIVVDAPDLSPILEAIQTVSMHEKHTEVLDAITNIVVDPPDLAPLEAMFREIKKDISGMQQQMNALRSDNESLRALIARIPGGADANTIAQAVVDRLRKSTLSVDQTEVLQAMRRLEVEPQTIASAVLDKCKKYDFGHSEVLAAVRKIKVDTPNYEAVAGMVYDKVKAHDFGHGEVLSAVRKIRIKEPDLTPIIDAINSSEVNLDPVLQAINRIPRYDHGAVIEAISTIDIDHDKIADRVHQKVRGHDFGHSEVLSAVRNLSITAGGPPDHDAIAHAVHQRVQGMDFGHGEVLQAVKRIRIKDTDLSPVLDAINASEVDLTPIHEAITNIDIKVDFREVLQAIRRLNLTVDYDAIAETVAHRLDYDEMMKALRRMRPERPDMEPIIDAIRQIDLDLSPIMDAISNINVRVDTTELMQSINAMRRALDTLRLEPAPPPMVQREVPMATATVYGIGPPQSPRMRSAGGGASTVPYPSVTPVSMTAPVTPPTVYDRGMTAIDRSPSLTALHRAQSSSPQQAMGAQQFRGSRQGGLQSARTRSMSAFAPAAAVEISEEYRTPRYANRSMQDAFRRY